MRWAETDAAGIVYHACFLIYWEVGRGDFYRTMAPGWKHWEEGLLIPLVKVECEFHDTAVYDDLLTVCTTLARVGTSSYSFSYKVFKENEKLCCSGSTIHVMLNKETKKPVPSLPQWLRNLSEANEAQ